MTQTSEARSTKREKALGPAPTDTTLHEAALAHLARYATTEAGLSRVLMRRIDRWVRAASDAEPDASERVAQAREAARAAVRGVVQRLAAAGALDDAAFAASRARRLNLAGRSRRAVAAHLAARGVDSETVRAALADQPDDELAAAVTLARRRRIGPFRALNPAGEVALKELGMLARAGFSRDVAERALRMAHDDAEALVLQLRQR